jgi:hypothetical protein
LRNRSPAAGRTSPEEKAHRRLTEALEIAGLDPSSPYHGLRYAELLDRVLADTATNLSESNETIPGATLLSASDRKCIVVIHGGAPLEEIRAGLDRLYKRQAPIWKIARRRARGVKPHPPRLVQAEGDVLLELDSITPPGQLRISTDRLVTAWAEKRPRPSSRWRRTLARDLAAVGLIDECLRGEDWPTRGDLADRLKCSPDQARRSMTRAAAILLRRHADCAQCSGKKRCLIGKWLVERAAGRAVGGDSLRRRTAVDDSDHLDRLAWASRHGKWNRGHRRQR